MKLQISGSKKTHSVKEQLIRFNKNLYFESEARKDQTSHPVTMCTITSTHEVRTSSVPVLLCLSSCCYLDQISNLHTVGNRTFLLGRMDGACERREGVPECGSCLCVPAAPFLHRNKTTSQCEVISCGRVHVLPRPAQLNICWCFLPAAPCVFKVCGQEVSGAKSIQSCHQSASQLMQQTEGRLWLSG